MDANRGDVLVRGGRFFPVYTRVRLAGASLAGSFLKLLGIYVGFSIEFSTGAETIVTTRVRQIEIVSSLTSSLRADRYRAQNWFDELKRLAKQQTPRGRSNP